jgi:hypothetical protein
MEKRSLAAAIWPYQTNAISPAQLKTQVIKDESISRVRK